MSDRSAENVPADRVPLGDIFVGSGEYVVIHGGTFGPFLNMDVAHLWACDAFGRGTFTLARVERPWRVLPGEGARNVSSEGAD